MSLPGIDREIIAAVSGDLPECVAPFQEVATGLGITEQELLARIKRLLRSGALRRFGATVAHKSIGFCANAMVVWRIPQEGVEEAARAIVEHSAVSHCYERERSPAWPYNLYAMVHGRSRAECEGVAGEISGAMGGAKHILLFTVREFKKSSPAYFNSANRGENKK
jgi:DNA-binding Lrp family transcriptional regulator